MRSSRGPSFGLALLCALAAAASEATAAAAGAPAPAAASAGQAAASAASEYDVKAVFIHHLTRYLQWPQPEAGRFEIAILGESAIAGPLRAIAQRERIRERTIAVRELRALDDLGQPQVLFVPRPAASVIGEVLRRTRGRPILTVTEEEGLAARGIAVNFVLRGGSVKFEINESALRASEIQAGSQLLRLAILVGGGP